MTFNVTKMLVVEIARLTVGRFSLGGPGRVMSLRRCAAPPSTDRCRWIHAHGILSAELPPEPINTVFLTHYLHVGSRTQSSHARQPNYS